MKLSGQRRCRTTVSRMRLVDPSVISTWRYLATLVMPRALKKGVLLSYIQIHILGNILASVAL